MADPFQWPDDPLGSGIYPAPEDKGPDEGQNRKRPTPKSRCCSGCRVYKPMEAFGISNRDKDGRQWLCRKCMADRERLKKSTGRGLRKKICPVCANLAHRRPARGCPKCGGLAGGCG